ncbi:hypothetical protein [Cryptosporidium parvum Iowa II]|uniref:F-box domain-containing protein n=2 Tax=Cryptosporidium parvum TaxID=5807 RepID=Q5CSK0_CRYPI|nr:hypothetical protein [Cryptosporidium parvum Iowa II]EAK88275.1 hypothetical protein with WD40 repeats [Cryptosporidium parvum Iowa II]QOY43389.1 Uncharacterized protein with WD40-repeat [Cryptosporidium parvum]WKS76139.1 hypothetical protein CPCDC_1g2380 [Cryptosporidium sp. 43IA8]WRK30631.1 WD40-repeat protein [Cryptosporidium parvum]|eukprot:QOY43389.1 hypothetical protein CPATCC_000171 [Cryptosporidium parvum]
MEKIPLELLATVSEYLQMVDIFSLLHLNRGFNYLWTSLEYWSIVCRGRRNYLNLLANEFNCILEDLKSFSLNKSSQDDLVDSDNNEYFGFNLNNLKASFKLMGYKTKCNDKSILWKIFVKRRLRRLDLVHLTSVFQDVKIYKYDKKIIAVFSPLIATISQHFLEIYELRNDNYLGRKYFDTTPEKLIDIKTKLITRLNLDLLQGQENVTLNNIEPKIRTANIVKWAFFDKNTILCVTKDYGIYIHEISNLSKRIALKKPQVNKYPTLPKVVIFEISGSLLAIGLEDGVVDIWKLLSSERACSNLKWEKWYLTHHCTIYYEHRYSRKSLIDVFEEIPSPLTWVNISHNCNLLLAIYKGVVNEIRIFSINKLDLNNNPALMNKIPLYSDIQMCQIDPKGRFVICVDSSKEIHPKTRFYSLSSGKLLLVQNFRIICPLFTSCGHLLIGAYRAHPNIPIEKSQSTMKIIKTSPKHINSEFTSSCFISIWSIPSLKEIYSFNCGKSEQIINIRFSKTRNSTSIITTTINKNSSDYIDGSIIKTSSNIHFISHDFFTSIKPMKLPHFF